MGIIIRKNKAQLEGYKIKSTTQPGELETGTQEEQPYINFVSEPLGGYHKSNLREFFTGPGSSPYSRQYDCNGNLIHCGLDVYTRHVQRLEFLLKGTGEQVMLLRRKWTGEKCPCVTALNNQARARCPICFATGFVGGYVQFINAKEPDGRIWIRVPPTLEDLELKEEGLYQTFEVGGAWTLPDPIVRDRDVVVRFDPDDPTGAEGWRYEILNVTRNVGFLGKFYSQQFAMKRMDKTDPIYSINVLDLANYGPGDLAGGPDDQQAKVEIREGNGNQAYNDKAFSAGYTAGYNRGYEEGLNGNYFFGDIDYINSAMSEAYDGFIDEPYGVLADAYGVDNFRYGFSLGADDGFRDGDKERKRLGRG